jgi:Ferritin-like
MLMSIPVSRIAWIPVRQDIVRQRQRGLMADFVETPAGLERQLEPSILASIRESIAAVGIPMTLGAQNPKEDLLGLLKLAAEIEHALMVQYLYSATSLRGSDARKIAHVAVQEMGHFVTVQNLLFSLSGLGPNNIPAEHHFGRDAMRRVSGLNPLPFILEKVSHSALAKYVVVERPGEISDETLRHRVEELAVEATQAGGGPPHPVSVLYTKIRWIFQPTDEPFGRVPLTLELGFPAGWHLRPEDFVAPELIDQFATTPEEWGSVPGLIISVARNNAEACGVIDAITEQGEGIPGSTDSHFDQFIALLNRFESSALTVLAVPRTPYVSGQPAPEDPSATLITNPYTQLWARLFNIRYSLLLLDLSWALSLPRNTSNRPQMIALSLREMIQVIKGIAGYLTARPLAESNDIAGPTFGLVEDSQPGSAAMFRSRYDHMLAEQELLVAAIQVHSQYQVCDATGCQVVDEPGRLALENIHAIDETRRPLLPASA